MSIHSRLYSLELLDYSVSLYISRLAPLWQQSWRVIWLTLSMLIGILAITADQLYLIGWRQHDAFKIELAAQLFRFDRSIALGTSYLFLELNNPTEQALNYINRGLTYDPNAADLLQAQMQYSFKLGKKDEAVRAYARLALIAPNSSVVKRLSENH